MSVAAPERRARQPRRDRAQVTERHLTVVDPPRSRRHRVLLFAIFVTLFLILLGTAVFRVRLVTGQQHIDRLEQRAEVAQRTYDRLRVQVDNLSAPDRIVARARSLGMVDAQDPTWLAPLPEAAPGETDETGRTDLHAYLDVKPYLSGAP